VKRERATRAIDVGGGLFGGNNGIPGAKRDRVRLRAVGVYDNPNDVPCAVEKQSRMHLPMLPWRR